MSRMKRLVWQIDSTAQSKSGDIEENHEAGNLSKGKTWIILSISNSKASKQDRKKKFCLLSRKAGDAGYEKALSLTRSILRGIVIIVSTAFALQQVPSNMYCIILHWFRDWSALVYFPSCRWWWRSRYISRVPSTRCTWARVSTPWSPLHSPSAHGPPSIPHPGE